MFFKVPINMSLFGYNATYNASLNNLWYRRAKRTSWTT